MVTGTITGMIYMELLYKWLQIINHIPEVIKLRQGMWSGDCSHCMWRWIHLRCRCNDHSHIGWKLMKKLLKSRGGGMWSCESPGGEMVKTLKKWIICWSLRMHCSEAAAL
jgi:hypothetical protein